jgi:hypothetical protein
MRDIFWSRGSVILQGVLGILGVWGRLICGQSVVDWVGKVVSGWSFFGGCGFCSFLKFILPKPGWH